MLIYRMRRTHKYELHVDHNCAQGISDGHLICETVNMSMDERRRQSFVRVCAVCAKCRNTFIFIFIFLTAGR